MLVLTANAAASPVEFRASVGAQYLHDMIGEQQGYWDHQPAGNDGKGVRLDLAFGIDGVHVHLGMSTLAPGMRREYWEYGNLSGYDGVDTASALYLRLGAGFERSVRRDLVVTCAAGLLWARHRLDQHGTGYSGPFGRVTQYEWDNRDDDLHYGGWGELKLSWVPVPARHTISIDTGLAYEQLKKIDHTTDVTRAGLIPFLGVAYRWN